MGTNLQFLASLPSNAPFFTKDTASAAISSALLQRYKKSGWIEPLARGVWKKQGGELTWEASLEAWQKFSGESAHVGGLTAVALRGLAHFIRVKERVVLFTSRGKPLPDWFLNYPFDASFRVVVTSWLDGKKGIGIEPLATSSGSVLISTLERAILEFLFDVPRHNDCMEAYYLMQGLNTLRPTILQELLSSSTSIKVNRLFLFLAEKVNHSWFKYLDKSQIPLGSGPRVITPTGKFDSRYKIRIPTELL